MESEFICARLASLTVFAPIKVVNAWTYFEIPKSVRRKSSPWKRNRFYVSVDNFGTVTEG